MMSNTGRPIYLNLLQIRLPVGGVLSILHRITGVLLVLSIPFLVYILQLLNSGEPGFQQAGELLSSTLVKLFVTLVMWMLIQHSLSGIRHLLQDAGIGFTLANARMLAWTAFALSAVLTIIFGALLWL